MRERSERLGWTDEIYAADLRGRTGAERHGTGGLLQEVHAARTRTLANGQYLAGNPLHPTAMATSVRVRNGKQLVTDGPFAETHEQLGGYFLIEAKDLDAAIAVAGRIPMARKGTVEVRPIFEIPGLPSDLTIPRGHPRPISIIRQPPFAMRKALSDERCRFCSCCFDSQCIDELL